VCSSDLYLLVLNKCDAEHPSWQGAEGLRVSCETGEGLAELTAEISRVLSLDESHWGMHSVAVNARHQACLQRASSSLREARRGLREGWESELVAVDLREAMEAIGDIAGVVDTEEVLGKIFSSFCIGK
ncbi:MAG: tRNA uridine-5-carboxymethylaminomethyl(34) synthesis GTPase MnmE, partial [Verrucomicrobiales bacterium]